MNVPRRVALVSACAPSVHRAPARPALQPKLQRRQAGAMRADDFARPLRRPKCRRLPEHSRLADDLTPYRPHIREELGVRRRFAQNPLHGRPTGPPLRPQGNELGHPSTVHRHSKLSPASTRRSTSAVRLPRSREEKSDTCLSCSRRGHVRTTGEHHTDEAYCARDHPTLDPRAKAARSKSRDAAHRRRGRPGRGCGWGPLSVASARVAPHMDRRDAARLGPRPAPVPSGPLRCWS